LLAAFPVAAVVHGVAAMLAWLNAPGSKSSSDSTGLAAAEAAVAEAAGPYAWWLVWPQSQEERQQCAACLD
jgi:hypothetical protein